MHGDGSIAWAAACYAAPERIYREKRVATGPTFVDPWPWCGQYDRRRDAANFPNAIPTEGAPRVRMLVKAGALIAAEIDRLYRVERAEGYAITDRLTDEEVRVREIPSEGTER
jgi:hypothetical protein